ncbi:MAG: Fertility inhibition FinO-like protein [Proteobacteria bacterium]|nr:Fertility inhibition FinO-like protein [Pseudomonadota bacterium]
MPQDVNPLLDRLCAAFPACFDRQAPKPLKIGLGEELLALAGVHPALADLSRTQLRRALKVYTGAPAYRKALARGGPRYGLDGQPTGEVTETARVPGIPARPGTASARIARGPGNGLSPDDAQAADRNPASGMARPRDRWPAHPAAPHPTNGVIP